MKKVLVINLTAMTQHVGVVHADGTKDSVQIMPKRRVELREGLKVDPAWIGTNPGICRIILPEIGERFVKAAEPVAPPETEGDEQ